MPIGDAERSASAAATIEGQVELPKAHTAPVVTQRYNIIIKGGIVSTDRPMAMVYLEASFAGPQTLPTAQMAQKDLRFVTPFLPVVVGTKVEFPNFDETYRNIFFHSQAKRFDVGPRRLDERPIPSEIFDQPGLVTLHCDIHEHMRGLILVLATPHFALSDSGGHYLLAGLPFGRYILKAWISSKRTLERPLELKEGATLHVDFP